MVAIYEKTLAFGGSNADVSATPSGTSQLCYYLDRLLGRWMEHKYNNSGANQIVNGTVQLGQTIASIPGNIASAVENAWSYAGSLFSGPTNPAPAAVEEPTAPDDLMLPAE